MRITPSELDESVPRSGQHNASATIAAPCIVAWVGRSSDPLAQHAKALCEQNADAVATCPDVASLIESPPRLPLTHVLLAQTDRSHPIEAEQLRELQRVAPNASVVRWLGPLVAPSVGLPGQQGWIETISWRDSLQTLPVWLNRSRAEHESRAGSHSTPTRPAQGLVIVSRSWATADAIFDAMESIAGERDQPVPVMTWRRDRLTRADRLASAHVVWDDSVWRPADPKPFQVPEDLSGRSYRHIWMTGMATPAQIHAARRSGVSAVWNKPTRRESLESLLA
ncbi:hypothetical protein RISK_000748 [Rhodopirellula islandica]|uniref:Uncharacterized protein n=1 Tax=Rhodopirellula islandica TaxID=595434 RepID=A0A0J1BKB5_RHOIS|nr:hypothetical protein [Rhodopirellula islandica]KLU06947.1 hypothetical protein RISK_000748 [Rhodopirellula islandica]